VGGGVVGAYHVTDARRLAVLVVIGAALLALAVVVFVLNRDTSTDLLAVAALLGGLAVVVVALPGANGAHKR
jgi:uncharacterized membrane protein (DUF373 family)